MGASHTFNGTFFGNISTSEVKRLAKKINRAVNQRNGNAQLHKDGTDRQAARRRRWAFPRRHHHVWRPSSQVEAPSAAPKYSLIPALFSTNIANTLEGVDSPSPTLL
jgi:hypothetical protein